MAILKVSVFILCYFFARMALAGCEPFNRGSLKEFICWDEINKALISERCLKSDCDAKKFLIQNKARKAKEKPSAGPVIAASACKELQLPIVFLKDAKNNDVPFCLFNDSSVLDAAVVERLVL